MFIFYVGQDYALVGLIALLPIFDAKDVENVMNANQLNLKTLGKNWKNLTLAISYRYQRRFVFFFSLTILYRLRLA